MDEQILAKVVESQQERIRELEAECDRLRNALLGAAMKLTALMSKACR